MRNAWVHIEISLFWLQIWVEFESLLRSLLKPPLDLCFVWWRNNSDGKVIPFVTSLSYWIFLSLYLFPCFFRASPCKCKSLQLSADESTGSEPVFERSESGIDGCWALWPWMHCSVGHLASAGGAAPRTTLMNERETVRHERRDDTRRLTALVS